MYINDHDVVDGIGFTYGGGVTLEVEDEEPHLLSIFDSERENYLVLTDLKEDHRGYPRECLLRSRKGRDLEECEVDVYTLDYDTLSDVETFLRDQTDDSSNAGERNIVEELEQQEDVDIERKMNMLSDPVNHSRRGDQTEKI